jgi:cell division transport system permease protein
MYRVTRILRETFFGVKTDVRASFLKILTICVTLTTISVGLLLSLQINHTKDHWDSKIDVSVYLCTKISTNARCSGVASVSERDGVQDKLLASGMVENTYFENRDQAWKRFTERYSTGNITRSVSKLSIPESYRVKLVKGYTAGDIGELL